MHVPCNAFGFFNLFSSQSAENKNDDPRVVSTLCFRVQRRKIKWNKKVIFLQAII